MLVTRFRVNRDWSHEPFQAGERLSACRFWILTTRKQTENADWLASVRLRLPTRCMSAQQRGYHRRTTMAGETGGPHTVTGTIGRHAGSLGGNDFLLRERLPLAHKVHQPEEMRSDRFSGFCWQKLCLFFSLKKKEVLKIDSHKKTHKTK